MKAACAIFVLGLLLVGCQSEQQSGGTISPKWSDPGTIVHADEAEATDVLVLTIDVDDLFHGNTTKWFYRKLKSREPASGGNSHREICADGERFGYRLSLSSSPTPVRGTNIEFTIQYDGSRNGNKQDGNVTIHVPVTGTSGGKAGNLTYKSEWRPISAPEDAARKLADPQG